MVHIICKKFRKFSGQLFLTYGVWYGAERAVVEGFRTDSLYIPGTSLRVSQLLSAAVAVLCLAALIVLLRKYKKDPQPIEGVDFFVEDEKAKKKESEKVEEDDGTDEYEGKKVILKIKSKVEDDGEDN